MFKILERKPLCRAKISYPKDYDPYIPSPFSFFLFFPKCKTKHQGTVTLLFTTSIFSQYGDANLSEDKSFSCLAQVFYGLYFGSTYKTLRIASAYLNTLQL